MKTWEEDSMRIGIDGRFFNESGVGRYIRNLIFNLKTLDKKNEYVIFLLRKDYEFFEETANFKKVVTDFVWYGLAEQFKFPGLLNKHKLDLVHFPHFNVPIFYSGKFVVTIHDLIHQHHAMIRATTLNPLAFGLKQIGYRKVFRTAVTKSQKIFVPSNYVKELLMEEWKVAENKILVTAEAVDANILKLSVKEAENVSNKPYIFYVGNAHPHKNVEGLIQAFLKIKKEHSNLSLILAGHDHYFWERIKKQFQDASIIYKGFISDEELVSLYKGAGAFVLPSFEEGFGIPILEAMACSCPVISSNAGSLQEVGGEAAIYFDPYSPEDMEKKISYVLDDEELRKELIQKGLKRVKLFSWKKLANQTLKIYESCFSS